MRPVPCRKPNTTTDHMCTAITLSFVVGGGAAAAADGFIFQTLNSIDLNLKWHQKKEKRQENISQK